MDFDNRITNVRPRRETRPSQRKIEKRESLKKQRAERKRMQQEV
jgi:hypothetical protein